MPGVGHDRVVAVLIVRPARMTAARLLRVQVPVQHGLNSDAGHARTQRQTCVLENLPLKQTTPTYAAVTLWVYRVFWVFINSPEIE